MKDLEGLEKRGVGEGKVSWVLSCPVSGVDSLFSPVIGRSLLPNFLIASPVLTLSLLTIRICPHEVPEEVA